MEIAAFPTPKRWVLGVIVRAPDVLLRLAADFAVESNFAFLPHRRAVPAGLGVVGPGVAVGGVEHVVTNLLTTCNCYASVFFAALGCPVPPLKANAQLEWFKSNAGQMAGWFSVNRALAVERATLGYPTAVVAAKDPHGHIGVVMPPPVADPFSVYVSAAGAANYHYVLMAKSFGALTDVALYFTHN